MRAGAPPAGRIRGSSGRAAAPGRGSAVTGRAGRGDRGRGLGALLAAGLGLAAAAATPLGAAPLTETGRRAYETARAADDGATAALEEGERIVGRLKALAPEREPAPATLKPFLAEGEAARQALLGYRRLAQASVTDALRLLADVSKLPVVPAPDLVRRDTLEQHALLAAHEASVMAARTRAEAERLRAVLAEARLAVAEGASGSGSASGAGGGRPGAEGSPTGGRTGEALVPNLVGARLDAAVDDLEAAGLRLGTTTGPRDGFVVKQSPEAGAVAPRQTAVSVTLSATAATIAPPR